MIGAAAAAKSLQSCPTLWDPINGSPPGTAIPGILQARTLEWVAISFSNAWKWKVKVKSLSCFQLFATPWTAAYQAPPSMGFSRQEYWSGVPLPSPHDRGKYMQTEILYKPKECFILLTEAWEHFLGMLIGKLSFEGQISCLTAKKKGENIVYTLITAAYLQKQILYDYLRNCKYFRTADVYRK